MQTHGKDLDYDTLVLFTRSQESSFAYLCVRKLVLCGETYATRLWCVWELFVLFAFTSRDQARRKMVFVPLISETVSKTSVVDGLRNFAVSRASCFGESFFNYLLMLLLNR